MASGQIAVGAEHLQRLHEPDILAPLTGRFGVDHAAHLPPVKERRLLIDERHEAHGAVGLERGKQAAQLQQCGDSAGVIVGTGASPDRVVMGADEDDLSGSAATPAIDLEVLAGHSLDLISLAADRVILCAPLPPDVVRSGLLRFGVKNIALTDLPRERLDMVAKPLRFYERRVLQLRTAEGRGGIMLFHG